MGLAARTEARREGRRERIASVEGRGEARDDDAEYSERHSRDHGC